MNKTSVPEMFGSMVFNDEVMRARLPKDVYNALHLTIDEGRELDTALANSIATAMKEWALEKGATHFTHWFQPMTGITAEKHDSFIVPQDGGKVIMEFSGKELRKGEPDASSFPHGGLRETFEARGYTAWDPTSYAFVKDNSLCIPTVFCSYSGEMLDKKTPLLRSAEAVNRQAVRVLKLLGDTETTRVIPTAGVEQEYFLIDKSALEKRKDIAFTGRTLFGAAPPKGQQLDDHYFGAIRPRVMAFMRELNEELWKLGVLAKTEHNEAAPAQHELAPIYSNANTATDHNQLTMEMMKKVADRQGLACLLHEKPFKGINGSGKHNNWSLSTNCGENLFDPGKNPSENLHFLLFLSAVIHAVDEHQDLLRTSAVSASNDQRLGGYEAPPAIVSMFLGDELTNILESFVTGESYSAAPAQRMKTGVDAIPDFKKDTSDRNRTSPFAFTGNKFEFRMVGSSQSVSDPNVVLNTAVADALAIFAERLEKCDNIDEEIKSIIADTYKAHGRIIFNGNNYSDEWVEESKRRGLLNLATTPEALPCLKSEKSIALFERHSIFTETELVARCELQLENYVKVVMIEAHTMADMSKKGIIPAVIGYTGQLAEVAAAKKSIGMDVENAVESKLTRYISGLTSEMFDKIQTLDEAYAGLPETESYQVQAEYCRDVVLTAMENLRAVADEMEHNISREAWPFPAYGDLLYSV